MTGMVYFVVEPIIALLIMAAGVMVTWRVIRKEGRCSAPDTVDKAGELFRRADSAAKVAGRFAADYNDAMEKRGTGRKGQENKTRRSPIQPFFRRRR